MIIGVGGNLSGGKTVTGVKFCYEKGLEGKKVISNVRLRFPSKIQVEFMTNSQLVDFIKKYYEDSEMIKRKFANSVMLLDEIVNLLSARKSNSALNELMTNWFMMLGKLSTDVVMTYQLGSSQLDNRVREAVMSKQALCFRLNSKKQLILDNTQRKLDEQIYILVLWLHNLGVGMYGYQEVYNPKPYFRMYDTEEITLMDRTVFIKGGIKDLTKTAPKQQQTLIQQDRQPSDRSLKHFKF